MQWLPSKTVFYYISLENDKLSSIAWNILKYKILLKSWLWITWFFISPYAETRIYKSAPVKPDLNGQTLFLQSDPYFKWLQGLTYRNKITVTHPLPPQQMKLKRCNTHYTILNFTTVLLPFSGWNRYMHIRPMKHTKWEHFYTGKQPLLTLVKVTLLTPISSTNILSRPTGPRELFTILAIADAAVTEYMKEVNKKKFYLPSFRMILRFQVCKKQCQEPTDREFDKWSNLA